MLDLGLTPNNKKKTRPHANILSAMKLEWDLKSIIHYPAFISFQNVNEDQHNRVTGEICSSRFLQFCACVVQRKQHEYELNALSGSVSDVGQFRSMSIFQFSNFVHQSKRFIGRETTVDWQKKKKPVSSTTFRWTCFPHKIQFGYYRLTSLGYVLSISPFSYTSNH